MWGRLIEAIKAQPAAAAFAVLYLAVGVMFSIINPIHEATDELRHYRYVRYLADLHKLPVQSGDEGNAQAHHPPLYYATAALVSFWVPVSDPLYNPPENPHWSFRNFEVGTDNKNLYLHGPGEAWPWRDAKLAAMLARWVTLLWGAAAVYLTVLMARDLLPDAPMVAVAGAAFVALNGMFVYLGAAANNDVPAGLAGAVITLLTVRLVRDGVTMRRVIALGVAYGLANLVKFNLIAMIGVIELALLMALIWRPEREKGWGWTFVKSSLIIIGIATLISGWWYLRNMILYGEPTGFLELTEIWGFRQPTEGVALAWPELRYAWTSLWGRYGYGQIPLPPGYYSALGWLCGISMLGFIVWLMMQFVRGEMDRVRGQMIILLVVTMIGNFIVLFLYIMVSPAGAMGRFFFPGLPAAAVLMGTGLVGLIPRKFQSIPAGLVTLALLAFNMVALFGYIQPAYALPAAINTPVDDVVVTYSDTISLLDYEVSTDQAHPGDEIDVTLTWQVIAPTDSPYQLFIHVLDEQDVIVAQRDTYLGLGTYPSNWWRPGHTFIETIRVFIPETAYTPDETRVTVGFYHPDLGRLPLEGATEADSERAALEIGTVTIKADPDAEFPNQTYIDYGGVIALRGYTIAPRSVQPGQSITVTLYWEAINPPTDSDYAIFAHVVDGWDTIAAFDSPPLTGIPVTHLWEPGSQHTEERVITIPEGTVPGSYPVWIGLYNEVERVNIIAEDGRILDDYLVLGNIRVTSED